ncbi:TPA: fimbrial protein [Providencia rettgeri]
MGRYANWLSSLFVMLCCLSPVSQAAETTEISAIISDDIGCSMDIPSVLQFTPKRTNDFIGTLKTFEIKPLQAIFKCKDKTGKLTPKITLLGNTPYSTDTIFLDGTPNSAGFMLRLYDGTIPSLNDFYDASKAIARGKQIALTPLNAENHFQTEETFLVGLVGPVDGPAISGKFSATLIFNLIFQ